MMVFGRLGGQLGEKTQAFATLRVVSIVCMDIGSLIDAVILILTLGIALRFLCQQH